MLQPLNKRILVLIEKKPETTKSGIIIASAEDPRSERAKVVSLASDVELDIKKGDIIFYKSYTLDETEYEGKLYGFLKEEDILALEK